MQFIRLPKPIDIAKREVPELVADWMNRKSGQNSNISLVVKLWVNMLISWVVECLTCWMPHRRTFRIFTHWASAIWDLSNHNMFWIIPDPGWQKRITSSLKSINTLPFHARTSFGKIGQWGPHSSKYGLPCPVRIVGTILGICNLPNEIAGSLLRVSGRYLCEYYPLWDTAANHANHQEICSSESWWMHKWLAQSSLRWNADLAYPITY